MPEILPIVFGGGLDRSGGIAVQGAEVMELLDNVRLLEGRVVPRAGMGARGLAPDAGAYLAGGCAERTSQQGVLVVGASALGDFTDHLLRIYRTDGDGHSPLLVGTWQDPCGSPAHTRASLVDSGSRVFLAHSEPSLGLRAPSQVFSGVDNSLADLTADWAVGSGADNRLRFYALARYRDYLVGIGFGTNTDEDEGLNMARLSDPGDPTTFSDFSWVKAGQYGERLLAACQVGTGQAAALLLLKEVETYYLSGYDGDSFAVYPLDSQFGVATSALVVGDGSDVYVWSLEGPRRFQGIGPSQDISWPLGLGWPSAREIAAEGLLEQGFATYVPQRGGGSILFVFGTLAFVFDLRTQRWSHYLLGQNTRCGFMLYGAGEVYAGPSRGRPEAVAEAAHPSGEDSVSCSYTNVLAEGDETVELWFRKAADPWPGVLSDSQPVTSEPRFLRSGLLAETTYEYALRYSRAGQYSAGYTDADPSLWPASCRRTVSTTAAGGAPPSMSAPTGLSVTRTYECVPDTPPAAEPCTPTHIYNLSWTNTMPAAAVVVESQPPAGAWAELPGGVLPAGSSSYEHQAPFEDEGRLFRVRHRTTVGVTDYDSDPSNEA